MIPFYMSNKSKVPILVGEQLRIEARNTAILSSVSCRLGVPVCLSVVFVCGVQVALQLVEQAALELVPDEEVEVRRLVQVVAVRLHGADLLKGILASIRLT